MVAGQANPIESNLTKYKNKSQKSISESVTVMPISRYKLRNEYGLADPVLFRVSDRDEPETLLEGVAMAGLVGVLRQLGDLAQFAAEVFHDLHEEVMTTAARGHGLLIRVQRLEAEFPSIEKAFLSQTSHSHFTYNKGFEWHANLHLDQNLIAQGDLPRFVMDSYEQCRGPPRLFLLDKFDIAGAGACLKRYSDPSIFKIDNASSGMKKVEVKREKRARKIKKGRRWWNEDPPEIFTTSDFHAKLHQFTSDQNGTLEKNSTHGVKLKRRNLNGSTFNSTTENSYMQCITEMHPPKFSPECPIGMEYLANGILHEETNLAMSPDRRVLEHYLDLDKNIVENELTASTPIRCAKHEEEILSAYNQFQRNISVDGERNIEVGGNGYGSDEFEMKKIPCTLQLVDQKGVLADRQSLEPSGVDGYRSEEVTSELENYMDALTSVESEMETDDGSRVKHEPGFFHVIGQGMDSDHKYELQKMQATCSYSNSVEISNGTSCDWNDSLQKQRFGLSNSDTSSSLDDPQPSQGYGIASLDIPESFENLSRCEDANFTSPCGDLCLRYTETLKSSNGDAAVKPYSSESLDKSSEKILSNGVISWYESLGVSLSSETGNEVSNIPNIIPEHGEASSGSSFTDSTSIHVHPNLDMSLGEVQVARSYPAEISVGNLDIHEIGKYESDNILHAPGMFNFPSKMKDTEPIHLAESCADASSNDLLHSCHIVNLPLGREDDGDILEQVLRKEDIEDCSAAEKPMTKTLDSIFNDLSVTDICGQHCGTNDDAIVGKAHMTCVEDPGVEIPRISSFDSSKLMEQHPGALIKPDPDAFTGIEENITFQKNYLTNVQTDMEIEKLNSSSENSECSSSAIDLQVDDSRKWESEKTMGILVHNSEHLCDLEPPQSQIDDWREIVTECLPSESNNVVKDGHVAEGNQLNNMMGNGSVKVPSLSLLSSDRVKALPIEVCAQSDDVEHGCILGKGSLDGCSPETISSSDHIQSRDCFLSKMVSDWCRQQKTEASDHADLIGSEDKLNLPVVGSKNLDTSPCTPDSSSLLHRVHPSFPVEDLNSESFITSMQRDQESKSKSPHDSDEDKKDASPSANFAHEPAITSEQSLGLQPGKDISTPSEHEEQNNPESSDLQFKTAESPKLGSPRNAQQGCIQSPSSHEFDCLNFRSSCSLNISAAITSQQALELQTGMGLHIVSECKVGSSLESSNFPSRMAQSRELGSHDSEECILCPSRHEIDSSQLPKSSSDSDVSAAITSEQALKLQVGMDVSRVSKHGKGSNPEASGLQFETGQSVELHSRHDSEEGCIPSSSSHEFDSLELPKSSSDSYISAASTPVCPGLDMPIHENIHQRSLELEPNRSIMSFPLPDTNTSQASLEEMPPLPPLPPLEWRIGKLRFGSLFSGGEKMHFQSSFPRELPAENQNHQPGFLNVGGEIPDSCSLLAPSPTTEDRECQHILQTLVDEMPQPSNVDVSQSLIDESSQPPILLALPPTIEGEKPQHGFFTLRGKMVPPQSLSAPLPTVEADEKDTKSRDGILTVEVANLRPLTSFATPAAIEDEKSQNGPFALGGEMIQPPSQFALSPTIEDGQPNGKLQLKPTRPRDPHPLVEAVASHNRTMLRKVSERVRPEIRPKADENNSLLEQIRSKSFNLKPAVITKPAIQGPRTNLNVVAILEKANSIRQAFVGSDEDDDEDGWSDS